MLYYKSFVGIKINHSINTQFDYTNTQRSHNNVIIIQVNIILHELY